MKLIKVRTKDAASMTLDGYTFKRAKEGRMDVWQVQSKYDPKISYGLLTHSPKFDKQWSDNYFYINHYPGWNVMNDIDVVHKIETEREKIKNDFKALWKKGLLKIN